MKYDKKLEKCRSILGDMGFNVEDPDWPVFLDIDDETLLIVTPPIAGTHNIVDPEEHEFEWELALDDSDSSELVRNKFKTFEEMIQYMEG